MGRVHPHQIFHDGPYKTITEAVFAIAGWVDWYNESTLHGSLGMVSPNEFEGTYYAALHTESLPASKRHQTRDGS